MTDNQDQEADVNIAGFEIKTSSDTFGRLATVTLPILGSLLVFAWAFVGEMRETANQFKDFKPSIERQLTDMRQDTRSQFDAIQRSTAAIPTISVTVDQLVRNLDQVSKRVDAGDNRSGAQSDRLTDVIRDLSALKARIESDKMSPGRH